MTAQDRQKLAETVRAALGTCEYALMVSGNGAEAHTAIKEGRDALAALAAADAREGEA